MTTQFRLAYVCPSADGKTVTATVVDKDVNRFTTFTQDVRILGEDANGNPIVRFPVRKLIHSNVLDLDR